MLIHHLSKFGNLLNTFDGTGIISLSNGEQIDAEFILAQHQDGHLLLSAEIPNDQFGAIRRSTDIQGLNGCLADGRVIRTSGSILVKEMKLSSDNRKATLVGFPMMWVLGAKEAESPATATFHIANFLFYGTEKEVYNRDGIERHALSHLPLSLGDILVNLRWVPDYEDIEIVLRAQRDIRITCTAQLPISDPEDLQHKIVAVNQLCDLMSIVRGTLVSWTSFDLQGQGSIPFYSVYRGPVVRRYAGNPLIREVDSDQTKTFIEKGFKHYSDIDKQFQLRKLTTAYVETRDGPFLETRGMLIGVLVDYLASVHSGLEHRLTFLPDSEFYTGFDSLKSGVGQVIKNTYPNVKQGYLQPMLRKLIDINRRPLNWKLSRFDKHYDIDFDNDEITDFISMRDHLAHTGSFPNRERQVEDYFRMVHFLDRIILRLFDYRGPYYNAEHRTVTEI